MHEFPKFPNSTWKVWLAALINRGQRLKGFPESLWDRQTSPQIRVPARNIPASRRYWLVSSLVLGIPILASLFFLAPNSAEVPMGDSYIHFVYARNLVDFGELAFNPGMVEGIGTSSILWVLVLALLYALGISPVLGSKILGVALLSACAFLVFRIARVLLAGHSKSSQLLLAFGASLFVGLQGSLVWIALSGMETILFACLALLVLLAYLRERWIFMGMAAALLCLTRFEGVILAGCILLLELWYRRSIGPWTWKFVLPILLLFVPWMFYLQIHQGIPFPTSFLGKQIVFAESKKSLSAWSPLLGLAFDFPPVIYALAWLGFLLVFLTGAVLMPGPSFETPGPLGPNQFVFPFASILILLFVIAVLAYLVTQAWRRCTTWTVAKNEHRFAAVLLLWVIIHNTVYAFFGSGPGSAGRYTPMNHVLFGLALGIGVWFLRNKAWRSIGLLLCGTIMVLNLVYWQGVYQANIRYMTEVRIPAVQYVSEHLPASAQIGGLDLGPLRYYSDHQVVDMLGYVNMDILSYRNQGKLLSDFLVDSEVDYIFAFGLAEDKASGMTDMLDQLELRNDPRFQLSKQASFSVAYQDWVFGSAPISNYGPTVVILKVEPGLSAKTE